MITKRTLFNGWLKLWNFSRKTIYPPPVSSITTNNRLYPNYFNTGQELYDVINIKQPLILHFTVQADPIYNKSTQLLFDILADKQKYPLDSHRYPVSLANISCDAMEAKDLMVTYGVNKLPSLVRLHKQLPVDIYAPGTPFKESELIEWLKRIKHDQ